MPQMTRYAHGQFSWVDYMAHDADAAQRFYAEVFGWSCEAQQTEGGPPYWIFRKATHEVAGLGQMSDDMKAGGVPAVWNNYINVDDCAAAEKRCVEYGATVTMPTMQVMDAGWLAFLMDPTGASFALWQANRHVGAALVNEPGSFSWNELASRDVERAKQFYADAFGWTYEKNNDDGGGDYWLAKRGEEMTCGMMQITDEWPKEVPSYWGVYFTVESVDDAIARIESAGGATVFGPIDISIGRIGLMRDPQGGAFNLFQPKDQG